MQRKLLLLAATSILATAAHAQQGIAVNANGAAPDPSAILDVQSTAKGMLVPRMSAMQRTAINPAAPGLLVYDTDSNAFFFRNGAAWVRIATGNPGGADNLGNHTATQTVKLSDNWLSNDGGAEGIRVDNSGNVGVGIAVPVAKLDVAGSISANNPGNTPNGSAVQLTSPNINPGLLIRRGDGSGGQAQRWDVSITQDSALAIRNNNASTAMVIRNTNRVGIGTANPQTTLHVAGASTLGGATTISGSTTMNGNATVGSGGVVGNNAMAVGLNDTASGYASFAANRDNAATGNHASAFGSHSQAPSYDEFVIGQYATTYTPASTTGFNGNDRLFNVGNGNATTASDAFTILKNGRTGINNNAPAERLDVVGNIKSTDTVKTAKFRMTNGAAAGYILTSDATGNATWQATPAVTGDNLGNHTATQTVKLNNNWLSNDGGAEGIRVDNNGNVGVGTATPGAKLHVAGNMAVGNNNTVSIDKSMAVGDANNVGGFNSFASGGNNIVSGNNAMAGGLSDTASGYASFAVGRENKASANHTVALGGQRNLAAGGNAIAGGNLSVASGNNAIAIGQADSATATNAVAFGQNNKASGNQSFTAGINNVASGLASTALGQNSVASSWGTVSMGLYNNASNTAATALGSSNTSSGEYSFTVGRENNATGNYSIAMGRRTNTNGKGGSFVLGDSTGTYAISDAVNQMKMRFQGGYKLYANEVQTTGIQIAPATGVAKYFTNVAASYDSRSLVDKNYVDSSNLAQSFAETDPQVSSTTTNKVPKWNGTTLTDGAVYDDGTNIGVGITTPKKEIHISNGYTSGINVASAAYGAALAITSSQPRIYLEDPTQPSGKRLMDIRYGAGRTTIGTLSDDGGSYNNFGTLMVTNTGKVGINITSGNPDTTFHVNGVMKLTDGTQGAGKILQSDANGVASWVTPTGGADNLGNHTATQAVKLNNNWLSNDGGAEGIRVDDAGNVGVGTATPVAQSKLTVAGSASFTGYDGNFSLGGNRAFADFVSGYMRLGTLQGGAATQTNGIQFLANNAERMRINTNGNIGINNSAPAEKLDVIGNIKATDTVKTAKFSMTNGATAGHVLTSDAAGNATWQAPTGGGGAADNLGNHTATQAVKLNGNWLGNDGGAEGIRVDNAGNVGIGVAAPAAPLEVGGTVRISSATNSNIELNSAGQANIYPNGPNTPTNVNMQVRSKGSGTLALNYDNPGVVSMVAGGGGVLIGAGSSVTAHLQVNGSTYLNGFTKVGTNGSAIKSIIHFGLGATGTTFVASEGTYEYTFSGITDVTTASSVVVNPAAPLTPGFVLAYSYVSAPGEVKVVIQNTKSSAQNLALSQFIFTITNY